VRCRHEQLSSSPDHGSRTREFDESVIRRVSDQARQINSNGQGVVDNFAQSFTFRFNELNPDGTILRPTFFG
jgi:hypothetical protein